MLERERRVVQLQGRKRREKEVEKIGGIIFFLKIFNRQYISISLLGFLREKVG